MEEKKNFFFEIYKRHEFLSNYYYRYYDYKLLSNLKRDIWLATSNAWEYSKDIININYWTMDIEYIPKTREMINTYYLTGHFGGSVG